PRLHGKKLGVVNGSSWVSLWSTYFGSRIIPEVQIIQTGNEAVQLNFMDAHRRHAPCPPQSNIDLFVRHAKDLVELSNVDAILVSCSTMNRSAGAVRDAMAPLGVPVVQIDEAMMEEAVRRGGKILVIATHGPTVKSTQDLLSETAERLSAEINFVGAMGKPGGIQTVVLAQLSMTVFKLSSPDCEEQFGVRVLTSGETGFARVRETLLGEPAREPR
ncbi:MAG: hypothetical protein EA426_16555, partial [Spirochaetaceae bacterium]